MAGKHAMATQPQTTIVCAEEIPRSKGYTRTYFTQSYEPGLVPPFPAFSVKSIEHFRIGSSRNWIAAIKILFHDGTTMTAPMAGFAIIEQCDSPSNYEAESTPLFSPISLASPKRKPFGWLSELARL